MSLNRSSSDFYTHSHVSYTCWTVDRTTRFNFSLVSLLLTSLFNTESDDCWIPEERNSNFGLLWFIMSIWLGSRPINAVFFSRTHGPYEPWPSPSTGQSQDRTEPERPTGNNRHRSVRSTAGGNDPWIFTSKLYQVEDGLNLAPQCDCSWRPLMLLLLGRILWSWPREKRREKK